MPNRIIKESICTSESINSLSDQEEAFFYRLIVNCDDYGRMDARPAILKARLFPLKDVRLMQITVCLEKLSSVGMVETYEVDSKPFLQIVAWEKHQQIRSKKSKYPANDSKNSILIAHDIKCNQTKSNVPVIQSESESIATAATGAQARDNFNLYNYYEQNIGLFSGSAMRELPEYSKQGISDEVIKLAIDEAVDNNARTWKYINVILDRCLRGKVFTLDDWNNAVEQRKSQLSAKSKTGDTKKQSDYSNTSRYAAEESDFAALGGGDEHG